MLIKFMSISPSASEQEQFMKYILHINDTKAKNKS